MTAMAITPLAMSVTKDDLLKHLDLSAETYSLMAKEADRAYKWLTSDEKHLKKNLKRKPPYEWSDMTERSKSDAMVMLACSDDIRTAQYWQLASESSSDGCPNWVARWFLYHKFRYRDGRNKGKVVDKCSSSKLSVENPTAEESSAALMQQNEIQGCYYSSRGFIGGSPTQSSPVGYSEQDPGVSQWSTYSQSGAFTPNGDVHGRDDQRGFYDPVKGRWMDKQSPN